MIKILYLGPDFGYHAVVAKFNNLAEIIHVDSSDVALKDAISNADALKVFDELRVTHGQS